MRRAARSPYERRPCFVENIVQRTRTGSGLGQKYHSGVCLALSGPLRIAVGDYLADVAVASGLFEWLMDRVG
jgi:hypothetical protein